VHISFIIWSNNMTLTPDQVLAANKANLETLAGLTTQAFAGVEQIIALNMSAAKSALGDAQHHTESLMSVRDAQELLSLQAQMFQPLAEKAAAYNRQLFDIAQHTGGQFGQVVEGQVGQAQAAVEALVKNLTQNAPAGTEAASQALKAAVAAGNTALGSVQKAVHQANEMMQANMSQMAQAVPAAAKARPAAKKR